MSNAPKNAEREDMVISLFGRGGAGQVEHAQDRMTRDRRTRKRNKNSRRSGQRLQYHAGNHFKRAPRGLWRHGKKVLNGAATRKALASSSRRAATRSAMGTTRLVGMVGRAARVAPWATIILAVGMLALRRMGGGRSFRMWSEDLSEMAFGDKPAEARAAQITRQDLQSNSMAMFMLGQQGAGGSVHNQLKDAYGDLYSINRMVEINRVAIERDPHFDEDEIMDVIADFINEMSAGGHMFKHLLGPLEEAFDALRDTTDEMFPNLAPHDAQKRMRRRIEAR